MSLLAAMRARISGIKIQGDHGASAFMRRDEGIDQDLVDRYRRLRRLGVLKTAQARGTCQRFIAAGGHLMNRVVA